MKRKRMSWALITIAAVTVTAVVAYHELRGHASVPGFRVDPIAVGDVVRTVTADGTLQAVTTVKVGAQVSGTISEVDADFNSVVRKGQVLARLDPALIQTEVEEARAALAGARADADQAHVAVEDARVKLAQAQALAGRQVITPSDLEDARVAMDTAQADLHAKQAQVRQAEARLRQAEVDLNNAVIAAPIDGIIVARNVDPGQTVASSFEPPTLFEIAADLARMQLIATVDEADIGLVEPGQSVQFVVDAYPGKTFTGVVAEVRLQPDADQSAVEYSTVVSVANPELRLRPGMTGRLTIEAARHENVLRVPSAALEFVPSRDTFAALGQEVPPELPTALAARAHQREGAPGVIWVLDGTRLRGENVTLGLSDGTYTEITGPGLHAGTPVVTMAPM
jgi:HlyD family secretion protein